jgi:hypothetical protein
MKISIEEFKWAVVVKGKVVAIYPKRGDAESGTEEFRDKATVVPVNWEREDKNENGVTVQVPV